MNEIIRYIAVIPDNTKSTVFENKSAKAIVGKEINNKEGIKEIIQKIREDIFSKIPHKFKLYFLVLSILIKQVAGVFPLLVKNGIKT